MKFAIAIIVFATLTKAEEDRRGRMKAKDEQANSRSLKVGDRPLVCPSPVDQSFVTSITPREDYQPHYLVGLLNYPNSYIPPILDNHTSGTLLGRVSGIREEDQPPYSFIPSVGFSDMEPYYDENGRIVRGEYFCLSDNGYGAPSNSEDYALNIVHMKVIKPFSYRHGEHNPAIKEVYTETTNLGTALIMTQIVAYAIPDETWNDYAELRVLTGRDFDPEGIAVLSQECAIIGDELMPAIFAVNPTTGVVKSPMVRTPDIDEFGQFNGKFLSTTGDKVHCSLTDLEANNCRSVPSSVVDESEYRKHQPSGGFEGFTLLADGTIAAFLETQLGDTSLKGEPGVRVYRVDPGNCSQNCPPKFTEFLGFYQFEHNGSNIADVAFIPGSSTKVLVIERNGFPNGNMWPSPIMPANKVCVLDLTKKDSKLVFTEKKCILNYHSISDPWDVDNNNINVAAWSQLTNEALIVVDDYCIVAGTDTNYPFTNQFNLEPEDVAYYQEVTDTRFMVICFVEPILAAGYPIFN